MLVLVSVKVVNFFSFSRGHVAPIEIVFLNGSGFFLEAISSVYASVVVDVVDVVSSNCLLSILSRSLSSLESTQLGEVDG